ncbi:hypothetical protein NDU88_004081 [Pleurodeles waltl]|uniref:Fibrinogen C-terminal domain-containing protein n=1 Tax=Pleurodeles waltl TaxID=8319 RepID=A0AAV7PGF5_PLEWA|nr:hypothetical protein NDU88_004081 [Pleurodeles waltl]
MHHLETVEKAGRMKRYKVASSGLAILLRFCRCPEQSAVDPLAEGEEGDAEELWHGSEAELKSFDAIMKLLLVFVVVWQFDLSLENAFNTGSDKNAWKQIVKKMKLVEHAPLDCSDIRPRVEREGVYVIYPAGLQAPVPVFCDITNDGGPWTVFQKRFNGSLDFYRRWHDYRHGFGQADGEYWLGLQSIHLLTLQRKYELRIDLEDFEGNTASASYAEFSVSPGAINAALDGYTLHVAGFRNGGAEGRCPILQRRSYTWKSFEAPGA